MVECGLYSHRNEFLGFATFPAGELPEVVIFRGMFFARQGSVPIYYEVTPVRLSERQVKLDRD